MPPLLQKLRETNRRLSFCLDSMFVEAGPSSPAVTPEQMATLLSELLRTGAWLRVQPLPSTETDPELNLELARYRSNVVRLRDLLPSIHSHLLLERAQLEAQRARVQSAAEWARASRQAF